MIVGDLTRERDFIDVRDVAYALLVLSERGVPEVTYTVASGRASSMQSIYDELIKLVGLDDVRCAQ